MKEYLKNNYQIEIAEYDVYKEGIIFFYIDSYYYYTKTELSNKEINKIYNFTINMKDAKLHDFVFTIDNRIIKDNYILFKINVLLEDINIKDILLFSSYTYTKNNEYISMYSFWTEKLDYLEYQLSEISNNKLINNSFDYYLGIGEILLDYLKNIDLNDLKLSLSHKKIEDLSPIEFYNPLNITIDVNLRDIASYIKYLKDNELLIEFIAKNHLNNSELLYLFVRLSFPFKYFNTISNIIFNETSEEELTNILINNNKYEQYLKFLEKTFGYNIFKWIKKE